MPLPPTLLDLLCHRLCASGNVTPFQIQTRSRIRHIQQLAAHAGPVLDGHQIQMSKTPLGLNEPSTRNGYSLKVRQAQVQAVSQLEERVAALKDAAEISLADESSSYEGPHIPEAELRDIYRDLLSFPEADTTDAVDIPIPEKNYPNLLQVLQDRLPTFEMAVGASTVGTTLSSKLLARLHQVPPIKNPGTNDAIPFQDALLLDDRSPLRTLIIRLRSVLDRLRSTRPHTEVDGQSSDFIPIPLGLLSNTEWDALSQVCLDANDAPASAGVLNLMKRSGLAPSSEKYDEILNWYAMKGLVDEADTFFSRAVIDVPRDRQRDLLVKARVKADRLDDACALIHSFETQTTPAPIHSYTRVIQALFSQRGPGSEQCKAQAWDMFSHMRYVAHATADRFLYTVMIRACAESTEPEPERALDLFTEMTVDNKIAPTTYAYNAVIITCARSKKFALEAFRLAREMLNSHRDAYGETPARLRPDNATFCALLEAAKRLGDLPRARWILAQMTKDAQNIQEGRPSISVNERAMTHVFHAYASYRPPFRREAVTVIAGEEAEGRHVELPDEVSSVSPSHGLETAHAPRHPGVPQSRQEIIKEVSALFQRILEDRRDATAHSGNDSSSRHLVFSHVSLTTTLLNAYMAVHYKHSPPSAAYEVYANLFEPLGVPRDGLTYVLALEAYAQGDRASDSEARIALSVGRDVWKHWRELEDAGVSQMLAKPSPFTTVDARVVERAWSAMMRLLTLNGRLNEAIDLLHQFVEHYPPGFVKQPSPPDPRRSTRTSLYADRPVVRLTERSTVPEDRITPFLTFRDLNLLHHRAIAAKRTDYIAYIKWVGRTYEGALRRRRDATLQAVAP